MHAFAFFFDDPAISARTSNETREVILFLSGSAFLQSLSPQDRARLE